MVTVNDIFSYLNRLAPLSLAEDFDNPGLLAGNGKTQVKKALLCLDITSKAAEEAKEKDAQLLISHHPVIFKPIRNVLANGATAPVYNLINKSLSAICMHTNLDKADGGVNDALCSALHLKNTVKLSVGSKKNYKKITVFVPKGFEDKVRTAMKDAGAGKLYEYDGCSFETVGKGYFRPLEGANPFIGKMGKPECTDETRIEAICESSKVKQVVTDMLKVHPYEVPAYDIFDDEAVFDNYTFGRLGETKEKPICEYAKEVKKYLSSSCVKYVDANKPVKKIAVCSGACDEEFFAEAVSAGADTILTGELKHHMYNLAFEMGLNALEAGHFATETVVLPVLKEKLQNQFPDVEFLVAQCNKEPYFTV